MLKDVFGFVRYVEPVEFSIGRIRPLADQPAAIQTVDNLAAGDGYVYSTYSWYTDDGPGPVRNRPSYLFRLPPTHEIELQSDVSQAAARSGLLGLMIHLFAFLFGSRAQFADWWIEGRYPVRPTNDFSLVVPAEVRTCLDAGVHIWSQLDSRYRTVLTNALFLYNRTPVYYWDWERFQAEYQVFDALFRLSEHVYGVRARTHNARLQAVADHFGIPVHVELFQRISSARNELIHEGLWAKGVPTGAADREAFMLPYRLRRFTGRLTLAVLRVPTTFIQTSWWGIGQHAFRVEGAYECP